MTTLDKIKAEIEQIKPYDLPCDKRTPQNMLDMALDIIDKYAEQEPCDECKYKTFTELYFHTDPEMVEQEPCDDVVSRQAMINLIRGCNSALEEPRIFNCHNAGVKFEQYVTELPSVRPQPCDDAISREAVVDDFIEWREKLEYTVGEDYSGVHLLNVAIQKIWDMPSVTPKPTECGDAVSRQAVIEQTYNWSKDEFLRVTNPFDYLRKRIKSLPSVRPQEQTGKWLYKEITDDYRVKGQCSECKERKIIDNFCPNCGARMVEPQERSENNG